MKKIIVKILKSIPFPLMIYTRPLVFWRYVFFFFSSFSWSEKKTNKWELKRTMRIVKYAYNNIPYYRKIYDAAGIDMKHMKSWEDFQKLPIISKNDVKNNFDEIVLENHKKYSPLVMFTGGSTSVPMRYLVDKSMYYREWAFYYCFWRKHGFTLGSKCVVLRGDKVSKSDNEGNVTAVASVDRYYNWLRLDSDYVTDDKYLVLYDKAIRNFNCDIIQAYPSSLYNLALLYKYKQIIAPKFRVVFLGSENTYSDQLSIIKEVFNVEVMTYNYGHSEEAIIGTKYDDGNAIGFYKTYGHLELIDSSGKLICEDRVMGEMIATSYNRSMPLIRYRTNDFASYSNEKSKTYMKNCVSIERIEGRLHEFIVTIDNRLVSICTVGGAHISELQMVSDCQFEQYVPGFLNVNVVERDSYLLSEEEKNNICVALENKLESKVKVSVVCVDKIQRTRTNKKSMIIQHIDLNEYTRR